MDRWHCLAQEWELRLQVSQLCGDPSDLSGMSIVSWNWLRQLDMGSHPHVCWHPHSKSWPQLLKESKLSHAMTTQMAVKWICLSNQMLCLLIADVTREYTTFVWSEIAWYFHIWDLNPFNDISRSGGVQGQLWVYQTFNPSPTHLFLRHVICRLMYL